MDAGYIFSIAVGSAIVAGTWTGISTAYAGPLIVSWVGFAGCTSYFTAGGGKNGFIRSMVSNYAGVLIGCIVIMLGSLISDGPLFSGICTGFFTGVICYLAHCDLTKFVPCTFIGGFSTFASGGNWKMLLICLLFGNLVGVGSDYLGRFIYKSIFEKRNRGSNKKDWIIAKILQD